MSAELNHARVRVANAILVELRVAQTAGAAVHSHTRGVDTAPSHPRDHGLLVAMKTRSGVSDVPDRVRVPTRPTIRVID